MFRFLSRLFGGSSSHKLEPWRDSSVQWTCNFSIAEKYFPEEEMPEQDNRHRSNHRSCKKKCRITFEFKNQKDVLMLSTRSCDCVYKRMCNCEGRKCFGMASTTDKPQDEESIRKRYFEHHYQKEV